MTTTTLTTCTGKINSGGYCDKCHQLALTSSSDCGRLVPFEQDGQLHGIVQEAEYTHNFVQAAKLQRHALKQGGWGHAVWCNFQKPELEHCNCGVADLQHALKFYEKSTASSVASEGQGKAAD